MAQKRSLSEELLQVRAEQAEHWQETHGKLDGFSSFWNDKESGFLLEAKRRCDERNGAAADAEKTAEVMSVKRGEMSRPQKLAFIEEHGVEKFQALAN